MRKYSTMSSYQLEQLVLDYLTENPRSSIDEISSFLDMSYTSVYRVIEGRQGSRSIIGLLNAGFVRAVPGINYRNNRLCWLYELNSS
jgi:hypothetical protein